MSEPPEANPKKNKWCDKDGRTAIYRGVMQYLQKNPGNRIRCVEDENYARHIVRMHGNTEIPPGAKVVFLPEGDNIRSEKGAPAAPPIAAVPEMGAPFAGIQYEPGCSLIITLTDSTM